MLAKRSAIGVNVVKFVKTCMLLAFLCVSFFSQADDEAAVKEKLTMLLGLEVDTIADAPVEGLLQVSTDRGLYYVSKDGQYLVHGRIFNIDEGMKNETEEALSEMRLQGIAELKSSAITYKAKNEKHVITVFTDITCGYCRKLHREMGELNDLGITVQYFAFPRAGLSGKSYGDMVSVWCAENPQKALTDAKSGDQVKSARCDNKVAEQYLLGQKVGVNGTPNIILPDGSVIPGYQPAQAIAQTLQELN
ncbi:bifunctional protein-disulfide isomerase/oxidoreductase DsbC [Alteromonas sp. B31-7]|nr:bifunctional protein-disulfide isomerase/oxidoreductase DsbC [Alteromonas sp. B31-7]